MQRTQQLLQKEQELLDHITNYEKLLKEKKLALCFTRICLMIDCDEASIASNNVTELKFAIADNWSISYKHFTTAYDENNYINSEESEQETTPFRKDTQIQFGKICNERKTKYFIKGNRNRFTIYRNSQGTLRIINAEYDTELDPEEQKELIDKYKYNKDIPEWLAIRFFIFIRDNDWSDEKIQAYLAC